MPHFHRTSALSGQYIICQDFALILNSEKYYEKNNRPFNDYIRWSNASTWRA